MMASITMRGINDPIRTLEQAKADIERSRREQFARATDEEKTRLCTMWVGQIAEDVKGNE